MKTVVIHDVLQVRLFSHFQQKAVDVKSMFEWFGETMTALKDKDVAIKLACLANGVDLVPEWVDVIKASGWEVQLHGLFHHDMQHMSEEEVYKELKEAKGILEKTFEQKITEFYPPRYKTSPAMYEACRRLNLSLMMDRNSIDQYLKDKTIPEFYIHYWSERHIEQCHQLDEI